MAKLKKVAKAVGSVGSTKMGPEGEFLIKDQDFRTKGGTTVEPNKGLADRARDSIKKSQQVKDIKDTRPYYDGDIKKGRGVTIEPNRNVGKLAIDAKRPDMPDIKPLTDRDFATKGGRTIESQKEVIEKTRTINKHGKQALKQFKFKPSPVPSISEKSARKAATARKIYSSVPPISEFEEIKIKSAPKSPSLGQRVADRVVKAHESHLGNLAKKAAASQAGKGLVGKAVGAVTNVPNLARRAVGAVGGSVAKKVLSKTVGRALAPVGLAMDAYEIGTAVKEGYKAYEAGKEYKTLYEKMKNKKYKPAISPDGRPSGL